MSSTIHELNERFVELSALRMPDIERFETDFVESLTYHTGTLYHPGSYWLCYSASVAIDIVVKLMAGRRSRVGLITPTFDNLAGLFALGGIDATPIEESWLMPNFDAERIDSMKLDALFVVVPNNPTGSWWSSSTWVDVIEWAARSRTLLVADMSFRLFLRSQCWDQLASAEEAGAEMIVIEDTGKIISLLDTKASVLASTAGLNDELGSIHEQVLLNCSTLDLALLSTILQVTNDGEIARARSLVAQNRAALRGVLDAPKFLTSSDVSVEWLDFEVSAAGVIRAASELGLEVLPGRLFYWGEKRSKRGETRARVALMRDPDVVTHGAGLLRQALGKSAEH